MSNVEVNCPSARCEGTITLEYEWEPPDPSIGIRGGVSIAGIVDECECGHSTRLLDAPANTWPLLWRFGKDRIARWEDAAGG